MSVQITVSDQDHEVAMGRELLSGGSITFPTSKKTRNPKTGVIEERGRVLTTRKARLQEQVAAIATAIQLKNKNFHVGTDILLVGSNIFLNDEDLDYKWEKDICARISDIGSPYPRICIYTGKRIVEVYL
ncbi:MAG: hypothetical protein ACUZ8E_18720 [Candidatus Anammoxibacter sp.]